MEWQGIHRKFTLITANLRKIEAGLQNDSRHFVVIGVHLRFFSIKTSDQSVHIIESLLALVISALSVCSEGGRLTGSAAEDLTS